MELININLVTRSGRMKNQVMPTMPTCPPVPGQRTDRLLWLKLGRLVHDDEIELQLAGRQVLRD